MFSIRCDHYYFLTFLIPILLTIMIYRFWFFEPIRYRYSLAVALAPYACSNAYKKILIMLRILVFSLLILFIIRPQWVDTSSDINVQGIDIMLALDVSGSMKSPDATVTGRTRISVVKEEAMRFVDLRPNDALGVVIFGEDVMTRCPCTLDKKILKEVIYYLDVGLIPFDGTALNSALATCVNRLRNSSAKSKIVILITDGVPMCDEISTDTAIALAKKYGIKVYTIGVGGALEGMHSNMQDTIDMKLLEFIAQETNGHAFRAHNATELRGVYDRINELERTERSCTVYHTYYELFAEFYGLLFLLFCIEYILRLFVWKGALW